MSLLRDKCVIGHLLIMNFKSITRAKKNTAITFSFNYKPKQIQYGTGSKSIFKPSSKFKFYILFN